MDERKGGGVSDQEPAGQENPVPPEGPKAAAAPAAPAIPATPETPKITAADLYLFNEGTQVRLYEHLGAHPVFAGEERRLVGTRFAEIGRASCRERV